MKFFVSIILIFSSFLIQCQDFEYGISSGIGISNYNFQSNDLKDNSLSVNYIIGLNFGYKFNDKISINLNPSYEQNNPEFITRNNLFESTNNLSYSSVDIPILISYKFYNGFTIIAGLSNKFNINTKIKSSYYPPQIIVGDPDDNYNMYTSFYHIAANFGLGYESSLTNDIYFRFNLLGKRSITNISNQYKSTSSHFIDYNNVYFIVSLFKIL